jgi:hypothetical protein
MAALSVVMLLLGAALNIFDLTAVIIASVFLLIAREEVGYKSVGIYLVTVTIAIIIPITFVTAIEYAIIAIYPIFKPMLDKLSPVLKWSSKVVYILAASAGIFLVSRFLVADAPLYMDILLGVGCVLVFILYDKAISKLIRIYVMEFRHRLKFK